MVKPVGLPVIAPEGSRGKNLLDLVSAHLRRRNSRGRAAVVHRLDRDTSGVMVFATNGRAKKTLMDEWQDRARDRRYLALVEGEPGAASGRLDSWLAPAGPSRMKIVPPGTQGAQHALGSWTKSAKGRGYCLLEISLKTGRKHQIRVQLAALGHPVAGDHHYGARSDPGGRLMLHASLLELVHPSTNEILRFEAPAPPAFLTAFRAPPLTWSKEEPRPVEAPPRRAGRAGRKEGPAPRALRRDRSRRSPPRS